MEKSQQQIQIINCNLETAIQHTKHQHNQPTIRFQLIDSCET